MKGSCWGEGILKRLQVKAPSALHSVSLGRCAKVWGWQVEGEVTSIKHMAPPQDVTFELDEASLNTMLEGLRARYVRD